MLVISGSRDDVLPPKDLARVRELLPSHSHLAIEGAAHNLLLTHPAEVAAALRAVTSSPVSDSH